MVKEYVGKRNGEAIIIIKITRWGEKKIFSQEMLMRYFSIV